MAVSLPTILAVTAIASTATAAGSAVYQGAQADAAARQAESQGRKQERAQLAMQDELSRKQAQQDAQAQNAAKSAESRQRALAAGYGGASSTIRTNPLGLSGGGGGQNTLLGGV